eukprot:SAG11_NODE_1413_length_4981_cov_2.208726_1_plen_141_part_00
MVLYTRRARGRAAAEMQANVSRLALMLLTLLLWAPAPAAAPGLFTVEGGEGWELTFHEPVIAGGHLNTTLLHQSNGTQVQMLSNSLSIACLFFGIEEGRAKHVFSAEQNYGHGTYGDGVPAHEIARPYAFSSDGCLPLKP